MEALHFFNILLSHFRTYLSDHFSDYDFSKKGRISRVQLALLLRNSLDSTGLAKISDRDLLSGLASSFNLYLGSDQTHSLRTPSSSPLLSDNSALSMSECISLKHILQHKLKHFLREIIEKMPGASSSHDSFKTPRSFALASS